MKNSLKIMKLVSVFSIIFLTLLLTTCGGDGDLDPPSSEFNYWLSLGPEGGYVYSLAIDPITTTIYAGTDGGVFKSIDGGDNWTAINNGLTAVTINALAINPVTTTTIYAGTMHDGVFKSTDGGTIWTAINTGLTYTDILTLAIDPVTPTTLYTGTVASPPRGWWGVQEHRWWR